MDNIFNLIPILWRLKHMCVCNKDTLYIINCCCIIQLFNGHPSCYMRLLSTTTDCKQPQKQLSEVTLIKSMSFNLPRASFSQKCKVCFEYVAVLKASMQHVRGTTHFSRQNHHHLTFFSKHQLEIKWHWGVLLLSFPPTSNISLNLQFGSFLFNFSYNPRNDCSCSRSPRNNCSRSRSSRNDCFRSRSSRNNCSHSRFSRNSYSRSRSPRNVCSPSRSSMNNYSCSRSPRNNCSRSRSYRNNCYRSRSPRNYCFRSRSPKNVCFPYRSQKNALTFGMD